MKLKKIHLRNKNLLIKKKNNRSIQKKKRQYKEIYKYIKINILNIIKKNQSKGTPPVASEVLKKKKNWEYKDQ